MDTKLIVYKMVMDRFGEEEADKLFEINQLFDIKHELSIKTFPTVVEKYREYKDKKGIKFTKNEDHQIIKNWKKYKKEQKITDDDEILKLLFKNTHLNDLERKEYFQKRINTNFMDKLCYGLEGRTNRLIRYRTIKLFDRKWEKWTETDDDMLIKMANQSKHNFSVIGKFLKRSSRDCYERFRAIEKAREKLNRKARSHDRKRKEKLKRKSVKSTKIINDD